MCARIVSGGGSSDTTDSTDDATAGAGSNTTDGGVGDTSTDSGSGGGGLSVGDVTSIAQNVLNSWLNSLPGPVRAFFDNPIATVLTIVIAFVYQDIILPIVRSIFQVGVAIVQSVLVIGQSIAAIAQYFIGILGAFAPIGTAALGALQQFNVAMANVVSQAGIGAPIILALLWAAEVGVAVWAFWTIIESIDIPFINVGPLLHRLFGLVTFPVRLLR